MWGEDREYYHRRRADEELKRARAAKNGAAVSAHIQLAYLHMCRVPRGTPQEPGDWLAEEHETFVEAASSHAPVKQIA